MTLNRSLREAQKLADHEGFPIYVEDPDDCCAPSRCDVCRGKGGWNESPQPSESFFVECRYFEHGGEVLVYLKFADGEGAFAYDSQVENGTIKPECCLEPGYAHVTKNGAVFRHNEMIGTLSDFLGDTTERSDG